MENLNVKNQTNFSGRLQVVNRNTVSNRVIQDRLPSFTGDDAPEEECKKKKLTAKKVTNILGVAAWLALVVYGAKTTKIFRKNSPENLEGQIKSTKSAIKAAKENIECARSGVDETAQLGWVGKKLYSLGNWVQNATNKFGKELFNNFIYAFGTLVVMPTVVLLSPTKKEDSKKGDKLFTILRQPFSVAATLIMQYTFDKVLSKKLPDVIKHNMLENKEFLMENGHFVGPDNKISSKIDLKDILDKIKYNTADGEEALKLLTNLEPSKGGLKGIFTADELKEIFDEGKLKSYEKKDFAYLQNKLFEKFSEKTGINRDQLPLTYKKGRLTKERAVFDVLTDSKLLQDAGVNLPENAKAAAEQIKKFLNIHNRKEIITQRTKVGVNVVLAAPIACTFLNVIYGKAMKAIRPEKKKDEQCGKEVK